MTSNALPATAIPDASASRTATLIGRAALSEAWLGGFGLLGVSALAAVLYLANLTVSGFANTYYSAAALAASQSWSAWFFGSFDAANFITVDKPPLATMLMGLSVRVFGLNSWAVLLPEALCGVATVAVLFLVVRRQFGVAAATIAAAVTALTPAAVLIFRYNNPDALLTLLLVLAAGAFLRGLETGRLRWVIGAAILVGFAFNTKYLQAWLVLPAFAVTYALCAPGGLRRRLVGLVAAFVAVVVSSGWWAVAVDLIPAAQRPFIGGSITNSAIELLLGYDGLGRIFGQAFGAGPTVTASGPGGGGLFAAPIGRGFAGGGPGGGFAGATGILRMFNDQFGGQVAWLIPFSLIGLATGLLVRLRASRTDLRRAAYLMWGLWLLVHIAVFSMMSGIIHSYYVVVMAPAIGALVGMGTLDLWALRRRFRLGGLALATAVAISAVVTWQLLERTPSFASGLADVVLVTGLLCAAVIATPWFTESMRRPLARIQLVAASTGLAVLLAGPAAYALATTNTAYWGGDPAAGPTGQGAFGGPGHVGGLGPLTGGAPIVQSFGPRGFSLGGPGADTADSALVDYLLANRGGATWIVAVSSSQGAASIELAARAPVMAMGGFSGGDPAPTLAQLQSMVSSGQLRFALLEGNGPRMGASSDVTSWIRSTGTAVEYGGSSGTLYDLSGAAGS